MKIFIPVTALEAGESSLPLQFRKNYWILSKRGIRLTRKSIFQDSTKNGLRFSPFWIVIEEQVDPDISAPSHNNRQEDKQCDDDSDKGIYQRELENPKRDNKGSSCKGNPHGIAYIHCSKKERRFHFILGAAI